jgi:hypothetical protein
MHASMKLSSFYAAAARWEVTSQDGGELFSQQTNAPCHQQHSNYSVAPQIWRKEAAHRQKARQQHSEQEGTCLQQSAWRRRKPGRRSGCLLNG